ncbi:PPOX class F420-dependent oxidoreductase [Humibacter sp.]|jgi:PPOX class probable F420-dependent enzyme|uniref:PPOX class F420-dependent oxidoreductase n=1 Tax=Humibacter sp. TaxID=1940291 RepID=UPI002BD76A1F|nr:PPOX class F420-dependent oxidoreductase [Humibacter sp.]HVX09277.1 PPOX class F420-dependent oxidoreductase [Humibacter sp.]
MTASDIIPSDLLPMLEEPNFGFLGTVRPDDTVQVNPMWFEFDGEHIRFTHTTKRQKYRNLRRNPSMSLSVVRERDFYRFLEVRGRLVEVIPDPEGEFYVRLGKRYGDADVQPPADRADRVILVMSVEHAVTN